MPEQAVLDRIEDGAQAVLLVGEPETELVVPAALLPADAAPGDWLRLTRAADGTAVSLTADPDETGLRRRRVADKLAALRRRGCGRR